MGSFKHLEYLPKGTTVYCPALENSSYLDTAFGAATGFGTVCVKGMGSKEFFNTYKADKNIWWYVWEPWWK